MNVYELEKKATPGPLHMKRLSSDEEGCVDEGITLHGADGGMVAHTYGNPEEFLLLAHCRNHFIEALEALKNAPTQWNDKHDELVVSKAYLNDLIAKLETVEE